MTRRKALEQWVRKIGNCEVTPQAIWSIVKSLIKRDGPRVPISIHATLSLKYQSLVKATAIADCLENQFTQHDMCDKNHKQQEEARVQALLEAADDMPLGKVRPCDIQKLIKSLKLRKICGIDAIPYECLRRLPSRPLVHLVFS
jgi:hypothetical protein